MTSISPDPSTQPLLLRPSFNQPPNRFTSASSPSTALSHSFLRGPKTASLPISSKPHLQRQSPLFHTLPADIRLLIYTTLIAHPCRHIHILRARTSDGDRLRSVRCWMPGTSGRHGCRGTRERQGYFVGWWGGEGGVYGDEGCRARGVETRVVGMSGYLSLLRTCGRVYGEARGLLYRVPRFVIDDWVTLGTWRGSVPGELWGQIRTLNLRLAVRRYDEGTERFGRADDIWRDLWGCVRELEDLRKLKITFEIGADGKVCVTREMREEMLRQLEGLAAEMDVEIVNQGGGK